MFIIPKNRRTNVVVSKANNAPNVKALGAPQIKEIAAPVVKLDDVLQVADAVAFEKRVNGLQLGFPENWNKVDEEVAKKFDADDVKGFETRLGMIEHAFTAKNGIIFRDTFATFVAYVAQKQHLAPLVNKAQMEYVTKIARTLAVLDYEVKKDKTATRNAAKKVFVPDFGAIDDDFDTFMA